MDQIGTPIENIPIHKLFLYQVNDNMSLGHYTFKRIYVLRCKLYYIKTFYVSFCMFDEVLEKSRFYVFVTNTRSVAHIFVCIPVDLFSTQSSKCET